MLSAIVAALLAREGTNISWAHLTFNPWIGCTKVSRACDFCYADDMMGGKDEPKIEGEGRRLRRVKWGPGQPRARTAPANWAKPLRWQKIAAEAGVQLRVFCASLADWADNEVDPQWRLDLADLIRRTPNLMWMLLTKRIPNVEAMLRAMFPEGVPPNVWLGITICDQTEADRDLPRALIAKANLGISRLFLSIEPMLGPVNIAWALSDSRLDLAAGILERGYFSPGMETLGRVDLVICGGESGKHARPMHPAWPTALGHQCLSAGVAFHFKQWGEWFPVNSIATPTGPGGALQSRRIESAHMDGRSYKGDAIYHFPDDQPVVRVGASRAGRLLAGKEWLEDMAA